METLVLLLMVLTVLVFLMKQSFLSLVGNLLSLAALSLLVGLSSDWAADCSRAQLAVWIADQGLMRDVAVALSLDVALLIGFCMDETSRAYSDAPRTALRRVSSCLLRFYPCVAIVPVLLSSLVSVLYAFPGADFSLTGWLLAVAVLVGGIGVRMLLLALLPERDLRLELLFLLSVGTAVVGVVGTVNGQTAVSFDADVDFSALAVDSILILAFALAGLFLRRRSQKRIKDAKR
ncbi:MAG: hypothetical protein II951_00610 [Bacteroidales bacterium]|nr:hypothetical protein [Bacteroidales bacterium]